MGLVFLELSIYIQIGQIFPLKMNSLLHTNKSLKKMKNNPVIFRTLDIGADKEIPDNIKNWINST